MVSITLFIVSLYRRLRPEQIIQIRRVPPTKNLRAHLLGLTSGLLFITGNLCFNLTLAHFYQSFFVFLWFALMTYFAGAFIFLTLLFCLLLLLVGTPAGFLSMFMNAGHWYFLGYCFGAGFAIFYNDLLFLFCRAFEKEKVKIAFAYDTRRHINIIKSPIATQEHALHELLARKPRLKDRLLYDYHLKNIPAHPYTIAFVANPKIRKRGGEEEREAGYEPDPIARDRNLFLRAVDRALFSLETDPVIGRPEIWSRMRVVTIFNPVLAAASGPKYGLLEEFQEELLQDGVPVENNMLDPMRRMFDNFENILEESWGSAERIFDANDVDIIFALTASHTHTRAFAHFSDWIEHDEANPLSNPVDRAGKCFTYTAAPCVISADADEPAREHKCTSTTPTLGDIVFPELTNRTNALAPPGFRAVHDYCATRPGRIALNVISARHKTYIHEFAHAMSSAFHGTIADEYVDCFILKKLGSEEKCTQKKHFFVNRIDRNIDATEPIPVPKVFADYNCVQYHSDLAHPSAEEEWTGYFPDKLDKTTPCVMDRDITGYYRFDELLSSFIYDRMMAKVSRPAKCVHQIEPVPPSE